MYVWEWLFAQAHEPGDYEKWEREAQEEALKTGKPLPEPNIGESVSTRVDDQGSLYAYNDTYIDVRTPHDEKRGLITFALGFVFIFLSMMLVDTSMALTDVLNTGLGKGGGPATSSDYFFVSITPLIPVVGLYLSAKYLYKFLRLEAFTARRLIVRFNRVTRKVYLLRPKNIGGVVALDWDMTEAAVDRAMKNEVLPGGGFLYLAWRKGAVYDSEGNLKDDYEVALVGRTTANGAELLAFWEYIRRHMEIGPQAAPPPKKLLRKMPWPWLSFQAAWKILPLRGLRQSGFFGAFLLVKLMLLPVTLIHATGHWISLLLCYEPRFPKSIESAGK